MRFAILACSAIVLMSAATARERAFHAADTAASQHPRVSSQCSFKGLQTSGYRAAAGKRKICYFDCSGIQAALAIPGDQNCKRDQVVLIDAYRATAPSPAGRPRTKVAVTTASP